MVLVDGKSSTDSIRQALGMLSLREVIDVFQADHGC